VRGFAWSELRCRHFQRAVEAAGRRLSVFPGAPAVGRPDPWRQDRRRLRRWIESLRKPVAILAAWDGCAVQVLDACREIGASVPDDVAVVGVDNDELLCDLATPSLTSVDPDPFTAGYLAAELLGRMMAGTHVAAEVHHVAPVGIETRMSTEVVVAGDRTLADAVRYIREHACAGIKVGDVLARVPLSRRALESRFRKLFGRTPHEQILDVKLRRARDLLAATDLAQAEVAERSGFRHPEYLSVVFKKKFGESPGEFRRRSQR
jgi:LacI family transcriptional regulator